MNLEVYNCFSSISMQPSKGNQNLPIVMMNMTYIFVYFLPISRPSHSYIKPLYVRELDNIFINNLN